MPRGARLDAPGALHHVIVRGIERGAIFRGDDDRRLCRDRLGDVIGHGDGRLYAWCLMPNHVHALVRSGSRSLSTLMQRWIGPYAGGFNQRHQRVGHLFQNRFKSFLVEEHAYLLQLVRYIHLNPVRAQMLDCIDALDSYPWTGHSVLLGHHTFGAQDSDFVLAQFGATVGAARVAYQAFVRAGLEQPPVTEPGAQAIRRVAGGWARVPAPHGGRENWTRNERVLGSDEFIEALLDTAPALRPRIDDPDAVLAQLCQRIAPCFRVAATQVASPALQRRVLAARAVVCHVAVRGLGLSLQTVARGLGISKQSVSRALERATPALAELPDLDSLLRDIGLGGT